MAPILLPPAYTAYAPKRALSWLPGGTAPPAFVTTRNYIGYLMGGTIPSDCAKLRDAYTHQQSIDHTNDIRHAIGMALLPNVLKFNVNKKWKILGTPVRQASGDFLIVPPGGNVAIPGAGASTPLLATVPDGTPTPAAPQSAASMATMAGLGWMLLKLFM
jgi:hypothetical protein